MNFYFHKFYTHCSLVYSRLCIKQNTLCLTVFFNLLDTTNNVGDQKVRRRRSRGTSLSEEQPVKKEKEKDNVDQNRNSCQHLAFRLKPSDSIQTDFR